MCAQETVLLGTHNICFGRELRKLFLLRSLNEGLDNIDCVISYCQMVQGYGYSIVFSIFLW